MRLVPGVLFAVLLITPQTIAAQATHATSRPSHESRCFVDANLFAAGWSVPPAIGSSPTCSRSSAKSRPFAPEYPKPSLGFSFLDLGGGVMFHRKLGVGVSVVRTTSEDTVGLRGHDSAPGLPEFPGERRPA